MAIWVHSRNRYLDVGADPMMELGLLNFFLIHTLDDEGIHEMDFENTAGGAILEDKELSLAEGGYEFQPL